jgi:hypothetical protein
VDGADPPLAHGKRHVQPLGAETLVEGGVLEGGLAGGDGRGDLVPESVQRGGDSQALLRRHLAELAHPERDFPFLSKGAEAHLLQGGLVGGGADGPQVLVAQVVHSVTPKASRSVSAVSGVTQAGQDKTERTEPGGVDLSRRRDNLDHIDRD